MLIKEFRIPLPFTCDEYKLGQLWSTGEASKNETGGGEGIEVLTNEPFEEGEHIDDLDKPRKGQFTHKIYHIASRVPRFVRYIAPKGSLEIYERSWNCFPWNKTVISNPEYMKEGFHVTIISMHVDNDNGKLDNVHELDEKQLAKREIVPIDIVNDPVDPRDYKEDEDLSKIKSEKTGRGPFPKDWQETTQPMMCVYKLVMCEFKWWGLQGRVEKIIMNVERRVFTRFHRQVCCWLDKWYGLTLEDIRRIEDETKRELDQMRTDKNSQIRGYSEA
jgi:hypothetical protein